MGRSEQNTDSALRSLNNSQRGATPIRLRARLYTVLAGERTSVACADTRFYKGDPLSYSQLSVGG
jgi:hypothetical protein